MQQKPKTQAHILAWANPTVLKALGMDFKKYFMPKL
jgi:hypothetical protein